MSSESEWCVRVIEYVNHHTTQNMGDCQIRCLCSCELGQAKGKQRQREQRAETRSEGLYFFSFVHFIHYLPTHSPSDILIDTTSTHESIACPPGHSARSHLLNAVAIPSTQPTSRRSNRACPSWPPTGPTGPTEPTGTRAILHASTIHHRLGQRTAACLQQIWRDTERLFVPNRNSGLELHPLSTL